VWTVHSDIPKAVGFALDLRSYVSARWMTPRVTQTQLAVEEERGAGREDVHYTVKRGIRVVQRSEFRGNRTGGMESCFYERRAHDAGVGYTGCVFWSDSTVLGSTYLPELSSRISAPLPARTLFQTYIHQP
jgi:hypothetical protein